MTTVDRLLKASQSVWDCYYTHPFVQGIQDGTLDVAKFRHYILQDYWYLVDYAKTFSIGIAKAKSLETTQLFSGYIYALTHSEMDIHRGYMGRLALTQDEIDGTKPSLDNLSYTSYMLRVAYEESEVEILTAILACAISYEDIAKKMVVTAPACQAHPFYGDWISGYASEKYAKENEILITMVNRLTADYNEAQLQHLEDIFLACSKYELAFWNMAWNLQ